MDNGIKSQFKNNYVDEVALKEAGVEMPYLYGVNGATVLDAKGDVVFKGDLCIANMNGLKITARDDEHKE